MISAVAALVLCGCAKTGGSGLNDGAKRYLDSWIACFHPGAVRSPSGVYVISDEPGSGAEVPGPAEGTFLHIDYTVSTPMSLGETFVSTTSEALSQQIGIYDPSYYYGPQAVNFSEAAVTKGFELAVSGMREGGHRKCVVPGWYMTSTRYPDNDGYFTKSSGTTTIFDIYLREYIEDETKWELDSLAGYLARNYPEVSPADSMSYGFYLINQDGHAIKNPVSESGYGKTDLVYISYKGSLLNGNVFDSNPEIVTNWNETYEDITMGDSKTAVKPGFSYALFNMVPSPKATAIFISSWGYEGTEGKSNIPPYSPLRFDLEIIRVE